MSKNSSAITDVIRVLLEQGERKEVIITRGAGNDSESRSYLKGALKN